MNPEVKRSSTYKHPFELKMSARQSFRRVVPSGEDKSFPVILAPLNFTSKAKPNMA